MRSIVTPARHYKDNNASYYIQGTAGGVSNGFVTGITTTLLEGMFPARPTTPENPLPSPNPEVLREDNYKDAADAWTTASGNRFTFEHLTTRSGDVTIRGYWETGDPNTGECEGSIGCVSWGTGYPHLSSGRTYWVEEPPRWGRGQKRWTTDWEEYDRMVSRFEYLPALLVHEFGHVLGLPHAVYAPAIMGYTTGPALLPEDIAGVKGLYDSHSPHQ